MKKLHVILWLVCLMTSVVSAQWVPQQSNVNSNLFGVRFTSPMKGWIVGQNGTLLKTTDGGATWNTVTGSWTSNLNKIFFVDSTTGWIVGDDNTILETTDGGTSWQYNLDDSPYLAHYYGIFCKTIGQTRACWLVGGRNYTGLTVTESSNGDGQWDPQIIGFAGRLVRVFFLDANHGWAVGDSGLILSTANGGTWWNQEPSGTHTGLNDIAFFDSSVGLCVGGNGLIMNSVDGGMHWNVVKSNTNDILFRLWLRGDSTAYAVGGGGDTNIFISTDRGNTWSTQEIDAPKGSGFEDVCFVSDSEGWAVGEGGIIVHTTNGGDSTLDGVTIGVNSSAQIHDFDLRQNFPNPFNPTTQISYHLPKNGFVTLVIYDALGRKVESLVNGYETAGEHSVSLDAANLSSGVYFYRLQVGELAQTKKLVLVK